MQDCHPAVVYHTEKSLLGAFLYSKDIDSYKKTKSVLTKNEKTVYNNFKSKRLLNVAVDL